MWIRYGAISGFIAVALGAFGAHGLKDHLDVYSMGVYQTGVQYQMIHALALVLVGILIRGAPQAREPWAGVAAGKAFLTGTVIFSGSLYLLALTGQRWLGAITPLGGLAFLAGWIFLARAGARS